MIHVASAFHLLGRHVAERSHHLMSGRELMDRLLAQKLSQPEIGDLHSAALVDQDVFRLDVAMDDGLVMCEL